DALPIYESDGLVAVPGTVTNPVEFLPKNLGSVVVRAESVEVDGVAVCVTESAQLAANVAASVGNVDIEPFVLDLPERLVEVIGKVNARTSRNRVTGSNSARNKCVICPRCRLIGAVEHGFVKLA